MADKKNELEDRPLRYPKLYLPQAREHLYNLGFPQKFVESVTLRTAQECIHERIQHALALAEELGEPLATERKYDFQEKKQELGEPLMTKQKCDLQEKKLG